MFEADPYKVISNSNLMLRIGDYSYGKEEGLAILLSKVIYKRDLIIPMKQE